MVFDKSILVSGMAGKIKQLSGNEWADAINYFLTHRGNRPFRLSEYSLIHGKMTENHEEVIRRRSGPRTSTAEQFVVINDFAKLDTALVAIFYLVRT